MGNLLFTSHLVPTNVISGELSVSALLAQLHVTSSCFAFVSFLPLFRFGRHNLSFISKLHIFIPESLLCCSWGQLAFDVNEWNSSINTNKSNGEHCK